MAEKELKALIPDVCARSIDKHLVALGADKVQPGEESIVAAAEFKERDAALAATLIPIGIAIIGSILAANGGEGAAGAILWALGIAIPLLILAGIIHASARTSAAASRVINCRLEKGRPLTSVGTAVNQRAPSLAARLGIALFVLVAATITGRRKTPGSEEADRVSGTAASSQKPPRPDDRTA